MLPEITPQDIQMAQTIYNNFVRQQPTGVLGIQQLKDYGNIICKDKQFVEQLIQQHFQNIQQVDVTTLAQLKVMIEQHEKEIDQNKQLLLKEQDILEDSFQSNKPYIASQQVVQIQLPQNYINEQELIQLQQNIQHINTQLQQLYSEDPTVPVIISRDDYDQLKQVLTNFNITTSNEINQLQQEQIKQAESIEKLIQGNQINSNIEQQLNSLIVQLEQVKNEEKGLLQATKEFNLLQQEHDDLIQQKQNNDNIIKVNQEIIDKYNVSPEEISKYTDQFYQVFGIQQEEQKDEEQKQNKQSNDKSNAEFWADVEQDNTTKND